MKGPKQGIVRASFSGCPVFERRQFPQSHAMLLISVGQPHHEDTKLKATIELVNRHFKSCTLMLADVLQRHNIALEPAACSHEHAYHLSKQRGDDWLERNTSIMRNLTIPYTLKRWEQYLNHDHYPMQRHLIEALSKEDSLIQSGLEHSAQEYIYRLTRRKHNNLDLIMHHDHCMDYLKEECAIMTLWPEEGFHFEVYPAHRNAAMSATYQQLIQPKHPELLRPVSLRFKRYQVKENMICAPQYGQLALTA